MYDFKDTVSIAANIATTTAVIFAVYQLYYLRKQNEIETHLNFAEGEREIWLAALQQKDIAPQILAATWNNTKTNNTETDITSSEELFIALLLDHYEYQFIRRKERLISRSKWRPIEDYIVHVLSYERAYSIWDAIKRYYSADFVAHFAPKLRAAKRQNQN